MRLTKEEKQALFELTDVMTDRCPEISLDRITTEQHVRLYMSVFRKLRLELKHF